MPQDAPNSSAPKVSAALAAGAVVVLQAVLLAVASVVLAVEGFRPETVDRLGAELLAVIGVASAVAIAVLGRGLARRQRWSRSPILVIELICLPIAYTVVQNGKWSAGILLGLSAIAALGLLAASGQLTRQDD
jgi:hypothetical protein